MRSPHITHVVNYWPLDNIKFIHNSGFCFVIKFYFVALVRVSSVFLVWRCHELTKKGSFNELYGWKIEPTVKLETCWNKDKRKKNNWTVKRQRLSIAKRQIKCETIDIVRSHRMHRINWNCSNGIDFWLWSMIWFCAEIRWISSKHTNSECAKCLLQEIHHRYYIRFIPTTI